MMFGRRPGAPPGCARPARGQSAPSRAAARTSGRSVTREDLQGRITRLSTRRMRSPARASFKSPERGLLGALLAPSTGLEKRRASPVLPARGFANESRPQVRRCLAEAPELLECLVDRRRLAHVRSEATVGIQRDPLRADELRAAGAQRLD